MHQGEVFVSWQSPNFISYKKNLSWYLFASVFFLCIIIIGIFSQSITMILAFLMLFGVFILTKNKKIHSNTYKLTSLGLIKNKTFIPYSHLEYFYYIVKKTHTTFYLKIQNKSEERIYLINYDPAIIRDILIHRGVREWEGKTEPFIDFLAYLLKI
jgi:hypothetical protein